MQSNQNSWIQTVAEQEIIIGELQRQLLTEQHLQAGYAAQSANLHSRLRAWQTISLAAVTEPDNLLDVTCRTLVHMLGWSAAVIVSLQGGEMRVESHAQMTESQLKRLRLSGASTPSFLAAYHAKLPFSTMRGGSQQALALRVLFSTDDVIAVPLLSQDSLSGYLVVCQHGGTAFEVGDQLEYLSYLAAFVTGIVSP